MRGGMDARNEWHPSLSALESGAMASPVDDARQLSGPDTPGGVDARAAAHEAFWNLPNTVTLLRVLAVPALLTFPWVLSHQASLVMAWIYIVAAATDLLDGWLARRGAQVTKIGKLLDPLADKLIVTAALIVLLVVGRIPTWGIVMVVVIIGRELAVTGLRGMASAEGQIVPAAWPGKIKTVFQNIAISALLFPDPLAGRIPAHAIGMIFLVAATALTLWSGYRYFAAFFRARA